MYQSLRLFNKWLDRERIYEGKEGYAKGAFIGKRTVRIMTILCSMMRTGFLITLLMTAGGGMIPFLLNYEGSRQLYEYIMKLHKWVSPPFNADGWRLDVAADLGHSRI